MFPLASRIQSALTAFFAAIQRALGVEQQATAYLEHRVPLASLTIPESGVALCAFDYGQADTNRALLGTKVSLLVATRTAHIATWRTTRTDLPVLSYLSPRAVKSITDGDSITNPWYIQTLFLLPSTGSSSPRLVDNSSGTAWLHNTNWGSHMRPGNAAWQNILRTVAVPNVLLAADGSVLDGIWLDTCVNNPTSSDWTMDNGTIGSADLGVNNATWIADMQEMLDALSTVSGVNMMVANNLVASATTEDDALGNYGAHLDGGTIEGVASDLTDGRFADARWANTANHILDMIAADADSTQIAMSFGLNSDTTTRLYDLATYLLVRGPRTLYTYVEATNFAAPTHFAEFDIPYGTPPPPVAAVASLLQGNGLYQRTYSAGGEGDNIGCRVLVNPSASSTINISVPTGYTRHLVLTGTTDPSVGGTGTATIQDISGGTLSFAPKTAMILFPTAAASTSGAVPWGLLDPVADVFNISDAGVQAIYRDFPLSTARYGAGSGGGLAWQQPDFTNTNAKVALLSPYTTNQRLLVNIMCKNTALCGDPPDFPCDEAAYITWLHAALAATPTATAYQIHNEPQTASFWGGSAGDYAHLVKITADVIRVDRPDALIVLAGMDPGYCDNVLNALSAFPGAAGNMDHFFDAADFHCFGLAEPNANFPNQKTYDQYRQQYVNYKSILASYGSGAPIWITENVTYSDSLYTTGTLGPPLRASGTGTFPSQSEEIQAINLVKRMMWPVALGCPHTDWAQLQNSVGFSGLIANGYFDFTGLIRRDGTPKTAYQTFQKLSGLMAASQWTTATFLTSLTEAIQVVQVPQANGTMAYCVWGDRWKGPAPTVSLAVPAGTQAVTAISLIPAEGGVFPMQQTGASASGLVELPLGTSPLWVTPASMGQNVILTAQETVGMMPRSSGVVVTRVPA